MPDNQIPVPDLNRIIDELMSEHREGVEEVHLEPPTETVMNADQKPSRNWRNQLRSRIFEIGIQRYSMSLKENVQTSLRFPPFLENLLLEIA